MRAVLLLAILLPASLAGCSELEVSDDCGTKRTHHTEQRSHPINQAQTRTDGTNTI